MVGRLGQRLHPDRRRVPRLRRRLLGAGRPAPAGLVHHGVHAGGAPGHGQRAVGHAGGQGRNGAGHAVRGGFSDP